MESDIPPAGFQREASAHFSGRKHKGFLSWEEYAHSVGPLMNGSVSSSPTSPALNLTCKTLSQEQKNVLRWEEPGGPREEVEEGRAGLGGKGGAEVGEGKGAGWV